MTPATHSPSSEISPKYLEMRPKNWRTPSAHHDAVRALDSATSAGRRAGVLGSPPSGGRSSSTPRAAPRPAPTKYPRGGRGVAATRSEVLKLNGRVWQNLLGGKTRNLGTRTDEQAVDNEQRSTCTGTTRTASLKTHGEVYGAPVTARQNLHKPLRRRPPRPAPAPTAPRASAAAVRGGTRSSELHRRTGHRVRSGF